MQSVAWLLLGLGLFGLLTSTVFLGMTLLGVARFWRVAAAQQQQAEREPYLPPVSLLKPLHGLEVGLEQNLRSFYQQDYLERARAAGLPLALPRARDAAALVSRVEVLFCARREDDPGLALARRVAAEFPEVTTRFCVAGEPWGANAKVCSLETMAAAATHDLWVISDSDVRVGPEYLRHVVLPFADPQTGCATCLYRGVAAEGGLWSRLEAVGMSVEMSSGVCVSNLMEPTQFALGPTMVARRACVAEIGGFRAMVDYCADDFVLGNWIAAKGHTVQMIGYTIDHIVLHASFVQSMKHQVRWMKSTRFSRPKGHFGTSLTFGMPFGVLAWTGALLLGRAELAWALLAFALAARMLQAWAVARYVVRLRPLWPALLLFPLRDAMGMIFWALSYTSNRILWRGEVYELLEAGRMRPAPVRARR
ncbi:MAG: glycosyltransferase [Acidobacteriota bacterium]|nr:glycosyltransferase [Acidobacteriota bacterium]